MIRFVICIDLEAEDIDAAYSKLDDTMSIVDKEDFQWESTDEAYDNHGWPYAPSDVQRARMKKVRDGQPSSRSVDALERVLRKQ